MSFVCCSVFLALFSFFFWIALTRVYAIFMVALKGAATLKARSGCKNRLNGTAPVLPIEDASDLPMEFEKSRLLLAKGAELGVETPDGMVQSLC